MILSQTKGAAARIPNELIQGHNCGQEDDYEILSIIYTRRRCTETQMFRDPRPYTVRYIGNTSIQYSSPSIDPAKGTSISSTQILAQLQGLGHTSRRVCVTADGSRSALLTASTKRKPLPSSRVGRGPLPGLLPSHLPVPQPAHLNRDESDSNSRVYGSRV